MKETAEEIELRMKIISEALAEAQAKGSTSFGNISDGQIQSLVDPQDGLTCEGCE